MRLGRHHMDRIFLINLKQTLIGLLQKRVFAVELDPVFWKFSMRHRPETLSWAAGHDHRLCHDALFPKALTKGRTRCFENSSAFAFECAASAFATALPMITPSADLDTSLACAGVDTPKPTQTGNGVS